MRHKILIGLIFILLVLEQLKIKEIVVHVGHLAHLVI
jgi:hypothetical protein